MAGYMQLIIVGNVGKDPDFRFLSSGVGVCNFNVAVNSITGQGEQRQEKTTWVKVAAWRDLGEKCNQYVRKGMQVMVIGTVEARAYIDQSGQPQATLEMTARDVRFLSSRADNPGAGGQQQGGEYNEYGGGNASSMEEIPF